MLTLTRTLSAIVVSTSEQGQALIDYCLADMDAEARRRLGRGLIRRHEWTTVDRKRVTITLHREYVGKSADKAGVRRS